MATFTKFNSFVEELAEAGHNLGTATLKVALTNTAPAAGNTTWNTTDHPAPAAANGYSAGGATITTSSSSQTSGTYSLVVADQTPAFTATAGGIGPFRYAVIYNSSASNKAIGYYDYGSSITLNDTETLAIDYGATLFTLA